MVSFHNVDYFVVQGNTYGNLPTLKAVGAHYDKVNKYWTIWYSKHPLNNPKQRKKLHQLITELEENGCRFTVWELSGKVRA